MKHVILSSAPLQAHIQGTSQYGAEMNIKKEDLDLGEEMRNLLLIICMTFTKSENVIHSADINH